MRKWLVLGALALAGCGSYEVQSAVKATLNDPSSAQFKDVKRCPGDPAVWQGQVNAKNRMGGYAGYEPFFYDGVSVAVAIGDDNGFAEQMARCFSNLNASKAKPAP